MGFVKLAKWNRRKSKSSESTERGGGGDRLWKRREWRSANVNTRSIDAATSKTSAKPLAEQSEFQSGRERRKRKRERGGRGRAGDRNVAIIPISVKFQLPTRGFDARAKRSRRAIGAIVFPSFARRSRRYGRARVAGGGLRTPYRTDCMQETSIEPRNPSGHYRCGGQRRRADRAQCIAYLEAFQLAVPRSVVHDALKIHFHILRATVDRALAAP